MEMCSGQHSPGTPTEGRRTPRRAQQQLLMAVRLSKVLLRCHASVGMLQWSIPEVTFDESNKACAVTGTNRMSEYRRKCLLKRTISVMVGKGSQNHNSRKFHVENTDPERSHLK
jgi:hypothetical protein